MLARRHGHVAGHIKGPKMHTRRRVAHVATPVAPVVEIVEEETVKRAWNLIPSRIVGRASSSTESADSSCSSSSSSNTCEKPMGMNVATEISVGVM